MHLKILSAKRRPFFSRGDELIKKILTSSSSLAYMCNQLSELIKHWFNKKFSYHVIWLYPKLFQIWLPFLLLTSYVRASSAKAISQQIRSQFLEVPYLCDCWPDTSQRHCPAWHSRSLTLLQVRLPHYRFSFWSMQPTTSKAVIELQTPWLTHLPLDKMAAISQMIFSDAFS